MNPSAPSHETINTCIYAMQKSELRKQLIAYFRRAKAKRMARRRGEGRMGQMPDLLSTHVRPPEANDRAFPGH
jgi:IS30 family transposase